MTDVESEDIRDGHLDDEIIQANSGEVYEENHQEEMEESGEAIDGEKEYYEEDGDLDHSRSESLREGTEDYADIHSEDDELDAVLGDTAREVFEEMKDDEYNEEEYVTLSKVDDEKDEANDSSTQEESKRSPKRKEESSSKKDKEEDFEYLPVPPDFLHKWFFKQSSAAKKYSSIFITDLTSENILAESVSKWAKMAAVFCINYNREGKGSAMMNFSSDLECKQAREDLQVALGDGVKIAHPSSSTETDIKDALTYRFDGIAALGQKWLVIEDVPESTTEEQIIALFSEGLLAFRPDMKSHTWEIEKYLMPEKVGDLYLVEFASSKKAFQAVEGDKEYSINDVKLKVRLLEDYEDLYKKYYVKTLNQKREENIEEMERKKNEVLTGIKLSNEERLQCYKDLENIVNLRARLSRKPNITYEEKLLGKQKYTAKVYDIVRKIDADTDRRVKEGEKFPEHSRIMTRHTKTEFGKLAPHQRGTYEGKYDETSSWRPSSRGRGGYGGSGYRGRGRGDGYRGRGSDRSRGSFRGRGRSSYDRGSAYDRDGGYYSDAKRRRVDDYDPYDSYDKRGARKDNLVVTSQLKKLTYVLNSKMDEMQRIAGGMKARERELEDAVHSLKRKSSPPPRYDSGYQPRRGASRGTYGSSYSSSSYSSRPNTSSIIQRSMAPPHSRYPTDYRDHRQDSHHHSQYTANTSRYHHDSHHDGYGSTERAHYSSRERTSSSSTSAGHYSSVRRSTATRGGYSGGGSNRRGGGGYR